MNILKYGLMHSIGFLLISGGYVMGMDNRKPLASLMQQQEDQKLTEQRYQDQQDLSTMEEIFQELRDQWFGDFMKQSDPLIQEKIRQACQEDWDKTLTGDFLVERPIKDVNPVVHGFSSQDLAKCLHTLKAQRKKDFSMMVHAQNAQIEKDTSEELVNQLVGAHEELVNQLVGDQNEKAKPGKFVNPLLEARNDLQHSLKMFDQVNKLIKKKERIMGEKMDKTVLEELEAIDNELDCLNEKAHVVLAQCQDALSNSAIPQSIVSIFDKTFTK